MSEKLPKLPIGIQSFEELRTNNFLYVDKTKDVYELAQLRIPCFLSRPRRFGKSLLCSTFKALFEGKKHLFEGTWIADSDWTWQEHPVIHLDFNKLKYESPEELKPQIEAMIDEIAQQYHIDLSATVAPGNSLSKLIIALSQPGKPQPVVLIDEYDKPIINSLKNPTELEQYRNVLYNCYTPLKSLGEKMRFLFITGVSQFAKVSIFSALNHLNVLSDNPKTATICGYTQAELELNFANHLSQAMAEFNLNKEAMLAEIKNWYNGYLFTTAKQLPDRVYNPFSILNFFNQLQFQNYWFASGTPTFVIDFFKNHHFSINDFEQVIASRSELSALMPENLSLPTLLYQSGYLTIKEPRGSLLVLGFPNQEVARTSSDGLLKFVLKLPATDLQACADNLQALFLQQALTQEALFAELKNTCAQIPSTIAPNDEKDYQFMFWLIFQLVGMRVEAEKPTSMGRIDLALIHENRAFVIELKIRGKADQAIQQIFDRRYAERYVAKGMAVMHIGIVFDVATRTVTDCEIA